MSETIKAKTSQRLRRRRLDCHLRVSLTSLRNTIVPLLSLLLEVLADASYPLLLPLNLFTHYLWRNLRKKHKKTRLRNHGPSSSSYTHPRVMAPTKPTPPVRVLVTP